MGGGVGGRCKRRSEVFVKIQKKWGGVGSGRVGGGGQGGCERRIEVFVKIGLGGPGGQVRGEVGMVCVWGGVEWM